jgi:hypothetical protein
MTLKTCPGRSITKPVGTTKSPTATIEATPRPIQPAKRLRLGGFGASKKVIALMLGSPARNSAKDANALGEQEEFGSGFAAFRAEGKVVFY